MNWETVATFDNPVAAELAKNLLESHGLKAMLTDEETVAIAWQFSGAVGGIKLLVPTESLGRAEFLLEHKIPPPSTDEEIAEAVTERPEIASQLSAVPEPFDDTATDRQVDRAFKVSVVGLLFLPTQYVSPIFSLFCIPVQLYGLYLLVTLWRAQPPVRANDRWKIWVSFGVNMPLWFIAIVVGGQLVGQLHDPNGPQWTNTRFGGFDDHALTIDLPSEFGHDFRDEDSPLGPVKVRAYGTGHEAQNCFVQIKSLPEEWRPLDANAALKTVADRQFTQPGYKVDSIEPMRLGSYPGMELSVRYTDRRTGLARFIREMIVLVDRHVILLTADVPEIERDGRIQRRFFRSARLQ